MIPRVLEPEVMDTAEEAADYDAMDHAAVNAAFVDDLLQSLTSDEAENGRVAVLDVGTGTAQIPVELSRRRFPGPITGIDLAEEMLRVGRRNVQQAGAAQIRLQHVDAKSLPFPAESFDIVMSNSIVHHIPDPVETLAEMVRVLRPNGLLFVRDLLRPSSAAEVESLVEQYAGQETLRQQQLFRQSLHASLTMLELTAMLATLGVPSSSLRQSSDRHWTVSWRRLVITSTGSRDRG